MIKSVFSFLLFFFFMNNCFSQEKTLYYNNDQLNEKILVVYDSLNNSCIISKDSVTTYLESQNVIYELFNRGNELSPHLKSFREYNLVIWLGEGTDVMTSAQKDSIKAFLNNPVSAKSKLLIFSEDIGYQFGSPVSNNYDIDFCSNYLGFNFLADRPPTGSSQNLNWVYKPNTIAFKDSTIGFWPDVLQVYNPLHGHKLVEYNDGTANGIGNIDTYFNSVVFAVDVESLRPSFFSPPGSVHSRLLKWGLLYLNNDGYISSTVKVNSPNGGEVLVAGAYVDIKWKSYLTNNIKIEYTENNGSEWKTIISSVNASSENYRWKVPNIESNSCKIRISSIEDPSVFDISDNSFSITIQSYWTLGLSFKNNIGDSISTSFGINPFATNGLDPLLGEAALLEIPNINVFDIRFELPVSPPVFSLKDLRNDTVSSAEWNIKLQPGQNGLPIIISWDSSSIPAGEFFLNDQNSRFININMKNIGSVRIFDVGITSLKIRYNKNENCKNIVLNQGWNIISVPLLADDMSKITLFPNATSPLYGYSNGYRTNDTSESGKGYWIRYGNSTQIEVCGNQIGITTVPVNTGWNLIGIYDFSVPVNVITTTPANILTSAFYKYSNGYQIPAELEIGKGYWIRASQNGVINLNSAVTAKVNNSPLIDNSLTTIVLKDITGNTGRLYLNDKRPELSNLTQYDLPPMPPEGVFDVRFASDRMVENLSARQEIVLNSAEYPVKVSIEGSNGLIIKIDSGNESIEKIFKDGETILVSEGCRIFIEPVDIPKEFVLSQNYPNPFNPSSIINYQLPVNSKVTLKLYDILGRKVATLIDEQKEAGSHNYQLSIHQLTDCQLTSGVYFYELTADSFRSVKKMVLVK